MTVEYFITLAAFSMLIDVLEYLLNFTHGVLNVPSTRDSVVGATRLGADSPGAVGAIVDGCHEYVKACYRTCASTPW